MSTIPAWTIDKSGQSQVYNLRTEQNGILISATWTNDPPMSTKAHKAENACSFLLLPNYPTQRLRFMENSGKFRRFVQKQEILLWAKHTAIRFKIWTHIFTLDAKRRNALCFFFLEIPPSTFDARESAACPGFSRRKSVSSSVHLYSLQLGMAVRAKPSIAARLVHFIKQDQLNKYSWSREMTGTCRGRVGFVKTCNFAARLFSVLLDATGNGGSVALRLSTKTAEQMHCGCAIFILVFLQMLLWGGE